jgi:dipeptidyl aminopeptidase/acylaminoacyl peptidase
MEDFWFTAKDGVKVQGFIIRPPGFDAAKKYPVKFLIHGGPQGAWGDRGRIAGMRSCLRRTAMW